MIERDRPSHLPTVAQLARTLGVAKSTAARALAELAREGVIEMYPRHRTRVVNPSGVSTYLAPGAVKLYEHLAGQIERGEIRAGDRLPKVLVMAAERHVAPRTVMAAYTRLVSEGLAHRHGKQTRVGPPAAPRPAFVRANAEVWVLVKAMGEWTYMASRQRAGMFVAAFTEEMNNMGIVLRAFERTSPPDRPRPGPGDLLRRLWSRRDRIAGFVVAPSVASSAELEEWLAVLARFGAPTALLDFSASRDSAPRRGVFRARVSDECTAAVAVDYLADKGHRKIAYILREREPWVRERGARLAASARCRPEQIGLIQYEVPDLGAAFPWSETVLRDLAFLFARPTASIRSAVGALRRDSRLILDRHERTESRDPAVPAEFRALAAASSAAVDRNTDPAERAALVALAEPIWAGFSLLPVLRDRVTAVIAPNDAAARSNHLRWLEVLGIGVPSQVSLLSFDNYPPYHLHPISSVEHGYRRLGYAVAHRIIGDVPVKKDSRGDLVGEPAVVEKGSVGSVAP